MLMLLSNFEWLAFEHWRPSTSKLDEQLNDFACSKFDERRSFTRYSHIFRRSEKKKCSRKATLSPVGPKKESGEI